MFTAWPTRDDDRLLGGAGNDTLAGYFGDDLVSGGAGDDVVFEGRMTWTYRSDGPFVTWQLYDLWHGNDTLLGGAGLDVLSYSNRAEAMQLDLLTGTMVSASDSDVVGGFEYFVLGNGNDVAIGNAGSLGFDLGSGNDTLKAGGNLSYVDGGFGDDTADLSRVDRQLVLNMWIEQRQSGIILIGVENLVGARNHSNTIRGNDDANRIEGGSMSDTLSGEWGNDAVFGGRGDDFLSGGEENDAVYGGFGNDTLSGDDGDDLIFNEGGADYIYGGDGIDTITGSAQADFIYGGVGGRYSDPPRIREILDGGGGDDYIESEAIRAHIIGGSGSDVIYARSDDQRLFGGEGHDSLTADIYASGRFFGDAGNDTLSAIGQNEMMMFSGGDGDDLFIRGASTVYGGDGNDIVRSGPESATIIFADLGAGNDSVQGARLNFGRLFAGSGDDMIAPISAHYIYGGDGNDRIATESSSHVFGGAGDDRITLKGGSYRDLFYAGAGNDEVFLGVAPGMEGRSTVFSEWTGIGGSGFDRLVLYAGSILVSEDPVYDYDGRLTSISGFEEIVGATRYADIRYLRNDSQFEFGATKDILTITTPDRTYYMGAGADEVIVSASGVSVFGGSGNDTISAQFRNGMIYGGNGDDYASLQANVFHDAGDGNDVALIGELGWMTVEGVVITYEVSRDMSRSEIIMGAGSDKAHVKSHIKSLDLGDGNDLMAISTSTLESWDLRLGNGADHIKIYWDGGVRTNVTVHDFDVTVDRLSFSGPLMTVSNLDRVEAYAGGVRLVEQECVIQLEGVSLVQITDAIFERAPDFYLY